MFHGLYTSGDPMLDKLLYGASTIIVISLVVIFGSPLFSFILSKIF